MENLSEKKKEEKEEDKRKLREVYELGLVAEMLWFDATAKNFLIRRNFLSAVLLPLPLWFYSNLTDTVLLRASPLLPDCVNR